MENDRSHTYSYSLALLAVTVLCLAGVYLLELNGGSLFSIIFMVCTGLAALIVSVITHFLQIWAWRTAACKRLSEDETQKIRDKAASEAIEKERKRTRELESMRRHEINLIYAKAGHELLAESACPPENDGE